MTSSYCTCFCTLGAGLAIGQALTSSGAQSAIDPASRRSDRLAIAGMEIKAIHHTALTVTDINRSRTFYREILSLREIPRPPFPFPGAWFQIGDSQQFHLIVHERATFRNKPLDTRDVHFAVRVPDYHAAVDFLRAKGYREGADLDDPYCMILQPRPTAGFPQIYICDPDRHVIEINAERLTQPQ